MEVFDTLKKQSPVVIGAAVGVFAAPLVLSRVQGFVDLGKYSDVVWATAGAAAAVLMFRARPNMAAAIAGVFLAHGIAAVVPQLTA